MAATLQLTWLSWLPQRPCMLLRWPSTTILLDCAVDMSSLAQFIPFFYTLSDRLKSLPTAFPANSGLGYLKRIGDKVFVDGLPELHPSPLCSISMEEVDAILVSNWQSMLALPYYTEGTGFRGRVYASEPTLQFGRLMMEEMMEYMERVTAPSVGDSWKDPTVYQQFLNAPHRSPREWRPFYSTPTMEAALARVRIVAFKDPIQIDGPISVASFSSGHSIGSCNWLIKTDHERIGYISSTASRTTHTRAVDWSGLRAVDTLLVTSLSPLIENSPDESAMNLIKAVLETVKVGGNVILPVNATGTTYDLIEILAKHVDAAMDVPIYFISPVARKTLSYANVYAEWLSEGHREKLYVPEEPFRHQKLMENKRIRVYESLYGDFSRELRSPCVVFTGHPSLRLGDAPHLLEMWGNDAKNAIILSDADFPPQEVYGPFEDLAIRALFFPVDCRLDFSQLNPNVLVLIVPEPYTRPQTGRPNTSVEYSPQTAVRYEETVTIPSRSRKRRIRIHPEVAATLQPRGFPGNSEVGVCSIRGVLSCYDNNYELKPAPESVAASVKPALAGKITVDGLQKALVKAGLTAKLSKEEGGRTAFAVEKLGAVITLSADGLHTNIRASRESRATLSDVISSILIPF